MEAIKDRVRKLNAAVNAHDLNPIGDMYTEDAAAFWPGLGWIRGRQAIVAFYAQLLGALPDVNVTLKRVIEQGDAAAVEYTSTGTQSGLFPLPAGELPATNRAIRVEAASVATFDGSGRIKTQHEYFDQLELLGQLGLMPTEIDQTVDATAAAGR
jgi:uncharacterized protein (TIGR02246 family)